MKLFISILFCLQFSLSISQDIPYRDKSTYKLSLKMEFKTEPRPTNDIIKMESKKRYDSSPQMYLNTSLELLSLHKDDYKIKIVNSAGTVLISKKLKSPKTYLIRLGYASQLKDQTTPNSFIINFINNEKKITSQIILKINEDGDFMVNGDRFGKI